MKRTFFVTMITLALLTGCDSNTTTSNETTTETSETTETVTEETPTQEETPAQEEPTENLVAIGDTITTDYAEIKINNACITYEVLPDDTSSYYNYYAAETGNVYVELDVDVKNLQKQTMQCDDVLVATADYNDGFTYNSFAVVEDPTLGFTYSNISAIQPLATQGMRYLFNCPEEIDQTDYPLFIEIQPAGTTDIYKLIIR